MFKECAHKVFRGGESSTKDLFSLERKSLTAKGRRRRKRVHLFLAPSRSLSEGVTNYQRWRVTPSVASLLEMRSQEPDAPLNARWEESDDNFSGDKKQRHGKLFMTSFQLRLGVKTNRITWLNEEAARKHGKTTLVLWQWNILQGPGRNLRFSIKFVAIWGLALD